MSLKTGQTITPFFTTHAAADDALADADSLPTGTLYVNGTADAAIVTVTNITTGRYKAAVTLPSLTAGDTVSLFIAATMSGVATGGKIFEGIGDTKRASDLNDVSTADLDTACDTVTVTSMAANTVTASALATDAREEIADQVWDEVLTGATHNVATSAGRRLRGVQDNAAYDDGAIWIDTVNGTAGTTVYENGTSGSPVDTLADALTLATAANVKHLHIVNGSTITLASTVDNYELTGDEWGLAFGGQSCDGLSVHNAHLNGVGVTGTFSGNPHILHSTLGAITGPNARIGWCALTGTITSNSTGTWVIHSCWGLSGASFDFGAGGAQVIYITDWVGGPLEIRGMGTGDVLWFAGRTEQLTLAASCTGGTVHLASGVDLNNLGSGQTVSVDPLVADVADAVADAVWDETISKASHNTAQSAGKILRQAGGTILAIDATVNDPGATTTSFITDLAEATDDHYNDSLVVFTSGVLTGQSRPVASYNGTTKTMTFDEAWTDAPGNGDDFVIAATHVHTVASVAAGVDTTLSSAHGAGSWVGGGGLTVSDIVDGVWDEATTSLESVNSIGKFIIDRLAVPITVISPITNTHNLNIVQGDDYDDTMHDKLEFTIPTGADWPDDLTGYTITAYLEDPDSSSFTGAVVVATGSGRKVSLTLTSADTASVDVNEEAGWVWYLIAVNGAKEAELVRGRWRSLYRVQTP